MEEQIAVVTRFYAYSQIIHRTNLRDESTAMTAREWKSRRPHSSTEAETKEMNLNMHYQRPTINSNPH